MTEFRDLSKLPEEQRYWDELESRITAELSPLVRQGPPRRAWWNPLARRAWLLSGLAAAAALAALWLLPERAPAAIEPAGGFLQIPRQSPTLVAFIGAPSPPAVGALVLSPPEVVP